MNNQMTTVPTTTITPRALRRIANELIDVHAGKPSTSAEIDHTTIGAIAGIREMCEATMDAVRAKDPTRVSQGGDVLLSGIPWSTARLGEQKAGTILEIGSGIVYDLILLPGESADLTWAQAKAMVTAAGGDLPSGAEILMLERLLGAAWFKSDAYWTSETVRFEGDAEDSIQYFTDGCFDFTEPNDQMSVRGVRRVMVGDATGCGQDEVPAHPTDNAAVGSAMDAPVAGVKDALIVEVMEKSSRVDMVADRACAVLEKGRTPAGCEAAGALRTAIADLSRPMDILLASVMPMATPDWMSAPGALVRKLTSALRAELIDAKPDTGAAYNEGVEDCVDVVVSMFAPGHIEVAQSDGPVAAPGPDLSGRPDLHLMRAALFAPAPPLTVQAVAKVLEELVGIIEADDDA